jgi:hypothetical protein
MTETTNIVALPGCAVTPEPSAKPASRTPNATTVQHLEELLEQARSGEVVGVVTVSMYHDNSAAYAIMGTIGGYQVGGAVATAMHDISRINAGHDI